jgi:outer membrane assembly lipoprotein YfgL
MHCQPSPVKTLWAAARRLALFGVVASALAGCAADKPKPAVLEPVTAKIAGRLVWQAKLDGIGFPLAAAARAGQFIVAGNDGSVLALEAASGKEVWRAATGSRLSAGVGSDGRFAAVVSADNELIVVESGRVLWRQALATRVTTAPLVAGERVFVLGVDRSVQAFDALNGNALWTYRRSGEPLSLSHNGLLTAHKDTLIVGVGQRMTGLDPTRGGLRWETLVGQVRGTNEVERIADLVGPAVRVGNQLCARAFQNAVGCVDAERGVTLWSRNAGGVGAVGGNAQVLVGADGADRITAWRSGNGDVLWTNEKLTNRQLSGALAIGPAIVFGDFEGQVHFFDASAGTLVLRLPTDGSAVVGTPVLSGTTMLVTTRNGGLFAFRPE